MFWDEIEVMGLVAASWSSEDKACRVVLQPLDIEVSSQPGLSYELS